MDKEFLRKKIFAKINNLPALPVVIPKLLNLLEKRETTTSQIVDTVSHDPALTSKILQVANSAYYGFPQKISSLDRAIALLGFNMVKSLALSIGVIHTLPRTTFQQRFSHEDLWVHSLAVATLMRQLGKSIKLDTEASETLFVIGLLHDVGKIVLDQFFTEEFHKALSLMASDPTIPFHEAELETIGIDHGETGGLLLSRWRFPQSIVQPIHAHHQKDEIPTQADRSDVALLRVCDSVAQKSGVGTGGNLLPLPMQEEDLDVLGFDSQTLVEAEKYLQDIQKDIYTFYRAMQ